MFLVTDGDTELTVIAHGRDEVFKANSNYCCMFRPAGVVPFALSGDVPLDQAYHEDRISSSGWDMAMRGNHRAAKRRSSWIGRI